MKKRCTSVALHFVAFSMAFHAVDSLAAAQCVNPRSDYPSLSFSMTNIEDSNCKAQLNRARWLGFTSVTLSPAVYFNSDGSVTPDAQPGALEACLQHVKDLGFDVIYKPMIETRPHGNSQAKVTPKNPTLQELLLESGDPDNDVWRAKFNFRPGPDYQQKIFEPFLHWMETSGVQGTPLKASVVVATEMHRSLADYPKDWNNLMWNMRKRLESDGLRNQTQIGIDPTVFGSERWLAPEIKRKLSKSECSDYQAMLWTADFFSPSVYGDYKSAGFRSDPKGSIQKVYDNVQNNYWFNSLKSRGCSVGQSLVNRFSNAQTDGRDQGRATKVAWMGEIGFAGSLSHSYSGFENPPPYNGTKQQLDNYMNNTLKSEQADFQTNAPIWVKAVLSNARGSNRDAVNFWITGRYDLFGLYDFPPLGDLKTTEGQFTSSDPVRGADAIPAVAQIRDLLQAYTSERCPGWKPALPVVPARVVAKNTVKLPKKRVHRVLPRTSDCVNVNATVEPLLVDKVDFEGLIEMIEVSKKD